MTKSTIKKTRCMGCGKDYHAKRQHVCDVSKIRTGLSLSEPQKAKSRKMMFGKGGR